MQGKIKVFIPLLILATISQGEHDLKSVTKALISTLEFLDEYYHQMNLDALLGITLAEAQLNLCQIEREDLQDYVEPLLRKCRNISSKIKSILPTSSYRDYLFQLILTKPEFWLSSLETFRQDQIFDLGYYKNWTISNILEDKKAIYKGIPTDVCFMELLNGFFVKRACIMSPICYEMMLAEREDKGYLLTHRLMYVLILKAINCLEDRQRIIKFCSLALKEAQTNELFGFPQHDIFLEQVVLCGMSGFEEFLAGAYIKKVIEWLKPEGCFAAQDYNTGINARSTNVIKFGCTDHTTGLGLAALALNLHHMLYSLKIPSAKGMQFLD